MSTGVTGSECLPWAMAFILDYGGSLLPVRKGDRMVRVFQAQVAPTPSLGLPEREDLQARGFTWSRTESLPDRGFGRPSKQRAVAAHCPANTPASHRRRCLAPRFLG